MSQPPLRLSEKTINRLAAVLSVLWAARRRGRIGRRRRRVPRAGGARGSPRIAGRNSIANPAPARLLYARDDPPAPAILAAASAGRTGRRAARPAGGAQAANARSRSSPRATSRAIPAALPALVAARGRRAGAGSPRANAVGVGLEASRRAAATSPLARDVSPPRCWRRRVALAERRKLREYQSEDIRARPKRFEYEVAAAADRRANGRRRRRGRRLGPRGQGQRGFERRPQRDARPAARRVRARRRAGARLRPALAQHPGGALVPAFRRQLRLGP